MLEKKYSLADVLAMGAVQIYRVNKTDKKGEPVRDEHDIIIADYFLDKPTWNEDKLFTDKLKAVHGSPKSAGNGVYVMLPPKDDDNHKEAKLACDQLASVNSVNRNRMPSFITASKGMVNAVKKSGMTEDQLKTLHSDISAFANQILAEINAELEVNRLDEQKRARKAGEKTAKLIYDVG